eukprot:Cvel_29406.t1-p1 / transcript=Cvel_29406.t1 / gene=Cvel_29406 / organism=Chromera_velia_CCMP2878 / gene_product=hypothetical protein / transcript_product=hypothetical protein / location=Cvel_scaffold4011:64-1467(-) / protein_length=383 / sequence_SO=supercontig / SO=protein_coding / is_pseudo=false
MRAVKSLVVAGLATSALASIPDLPLTKDLDKGPEAFQTVSKDASELKPDTKDDSGAFVLTDSDPVSTDKVTFLSKDNQGFVIEKDINKTEPYENEGGSREYSKQAYFNPGIEKPVYEKKTLGSMAYYERDVETDSSSFKTFSGFFNAWDDRASFAIHNDTWESGTHGNSHYGRDEGIILDLDKEEGFTFFGGAVQHRYDQNTVADYDKNVTLELGKVASPLKSGMKESFWGRVDQSATGTDPHGDDWVEVAKIEAMPFYVDEKKGDFYQAAYRDDITQITPEKGDQRRKSEVMAVSDEGFVAVDYYAKNDDEEGRVYVGKSDRESETFVTEGDGFVKPEINPIPQLTFGVGLPEPFAKNTFRNFAGLYGDGYSADTPKLDLWW